MLLFPLTAPTDTSQPTVSNFRLSENRPVITVCYSIIFSTILKYVAFVRNMIGFVKRVGWTTELDSGKSGRSIIFLFSEKLLLRNKD